MIINVEWQSGMPPEVHIRFDYNRDAIAVIKSVPPAFRSWNPEEKYWSVCAPAIDYTIEDLRAYGDVVETVASGDAGQSSSSPSGPAVP